jgi:hypothetical protein
MYLEELVGVAVGLILVYLLVSVAVMSLQEWISGLISRRSRDLEIILREMLAETLEPPRRGTVLAERLEPPATGAASGGKPQPVHKSGVLEKIYEHPLIKSLYQGTSKPSYIPRDKFVLALFDIIISAGTDASMIEKGLTQLKIYKENFPKAIRAGMDTAIDALLEKARDVKDDPAKMANLQAELDAMVKKYTDYDIGPVFEALLHAQLPTAEAEVIKALKRGAATLTTENRQLKQTLDDLVYMAEMYLKEGESKLAQARANAEKWFDDTMDRASGWYKRRAQTWAFALGLILAIAFNVDSADIASRLWIQPALRQSLVKIAEDFQLQDSTQAQDRTTNPVDTISRLQSSFAGLQLPIGWTLVGLGPEAFTPATDHCTLFPRQTIEGQPGKDVYGMSINGTCMRWGNPPEGWGVLTKAIGFLITAMAAMQGAPFWFEILKKLVNVRSTGIKPEEKEKKK